MITGFRKFKKGKLETELVRLGSSVLGIDEVGRGCWAGPVCAGAVALDYEKLQKLNRKSRALIRDSKMLSGEKRREAIPIIESISISFGIGWADVEEVETLGLQPAIFTAMRRAITLSQINATVILIDGKLKIPDISCQQMSVVKGDSLCYAIAAASILAKEARDDWMRKAADLYPDYGFANHVGYGTKQHQAGLKRSGLCPLHRRNFAPIKELLGQLTPP